MKIGGNERMGLGDALPHPLSGANFPSWNALEDIYALALSALGEKSLSSFND